MPTILLKNVVPLDRWHNTSFFAGLFLLGISVTSLVQNPWLPSRMLGVLGLAMMFMVHGPG